ncbi:Translin [Cylindrobasidium torrendii FP15055 ss-10]|uniref:Translin n=1 Tax=Cylindrobasidium torrendii FP15055 ss-10 TaxID=1314674 RepID=A0A0D7BAN4_9AGAR|nr:Translin [Cylindrobasidium torrendii FP15055 ss-10]
MLSTASIFDAFRAEIDDHNDRRERLIKASRDITNISKKTIFLLHRIALSPPRDGDAESPEVSASKKGRANLVQVRDMYAKLKDDIAGDRFWRYEGQVSPGLQEYIEALSFAHFLEHGTLITSEDVQRTLLGDDGQPASRLIFPLTVSDYLLGISDLTGELMRYAISSLSQRGGRTKAMSTLAFVRMCKGDFDGFTPQIRNLSKKQSVTTQSMKKIEDAVYAIVVRTSEYDLPPDLLDDLVAQITSGNSDRKRRRDVSDDGDRENEMNVD